MRFGQYLEAEQVPEWAKMYVDYAGLKQAVGVVAAAVASQRRGAPGERMSLLRRTSQYLGYSSFQAGDGAALQPATAPTPPTPPAPKCGPRRCSEGGCSHFGGIVSATPQIAMRMSAGNSGRVSGSSPELAQCASIKLPLSARDSFTEGAWVRRAPAARDCISAEAFERELRTRLPAERDFFGLMEQELVKVNEFYKRKQAQFGARHESIKQQQQIYDDMAGAEPSAQLRAARAKIKRAILELHRGIDLLKNYRILCYTALIKALKKYQKAARWCAGTDWFLNQIDTCYIATSERLNAMGADLEALFIERYAGGSRRRGMDKLRVVPADTDSGHQAGIFRSGIMLGLAGPLIARAIYEANLLSNEQRVPYHRQLLQIYGSIFLVLLFLLLFSLNIMAWVRTHINYRFIFEIDPRNHLTAWQFLELSSLFVFIASAVLWVNFALHIDHGSYICVYVLIGVLLGVLLLPLRVIYWRSRWWLVRSLGRVLCSGLFQVEFRDFFLGDELCSLSYTLSMVLMLGCAASNDWTGLDEACNTTQWWANAAFLMLPNLLRLLQCLRRYADSGDAFPHLANGAKYSSTIVTVWLATANNVFGGGAWKPVWVASAIINSCFTSMWDLLMDWGLFEPRSKHRFLRSELKLERAWPYYAAMVLDVTLRFVWIMQLSPTFFSFGHSVHRTTLSFIAALLEVVRRAIWNFFRVENEHISNCGRFRATIDIPLPFRAAEGPHSDCASHHDDELAHTSTVVSAAVSSPA
ncbi:Signal transduction protein [Coemansia javaensis]|uniref:Signal transduction protein n=1 Tax=Coemansia javaensis TaxID=2761396 RepID=A0A9W8H7X4_9FUNG|nr:Signal transduction protein [Coemansia javaensis]